MPIEHGMIHLYCGNGKGKTTAAVGLAVRAVGQKNTVCFTQFLKTSHTGELEVLGHFDNICVIRDTEKRKFTYEMTQEELEECGRIQQGLFEKSMAYCRRNKVNMLVLDELTAATNKGMIDMKKLLKFLDTKPENLEVVMTGRNPMNELLERADYVTEMQKIKHPYDKGIAARIGIEI